MGRPGRGVGAARLRARRARDRDVLEAMIELGADPDAAAASSPRSSSASSATAGRRSPPSRTPRCARSPSTSRTLTCWPRSPARSATSATRTATTGCSPARRPGGDVREAVAFALGGRPGEDVSQALIALSADAEDDVRDWATFALGTLAEADSPGCATRSPPASTTPTRRPGWRPSTASRCAATRARTEPARDLLAAHGDAEDERLARHLLAETASHIEPSTRGAPQSGARRKRTQAGCTKRLGRPVRGAPRRGSEAEVTTRRAWRPGRPELGDHSRRPRRRRGRRSLLHGRGGRSLGRRGRGSLGDGAGASDPGAAVARGAGAGGLRPAPLLGGRPRPAAPGSGRAPGLRGRRGRLGRPGGRSLLDRRAARAREAGRRGLVDRRRRGRSSWTGGSARRAGRPGREGRAGLGTVVDRRGRDRQSCPGSRRRSGRPGRPGSGRRRCPREGVSAVGLLDPVGTPSSRSRRRHRCRRRRSESACGRPEGCGSGLSS